MSSLISDLVEKRLMKTKNSVVEIQNAVVLESFFNKVVVLTAEIFKNSFFCRTPPVAASVKSRQAEWNPVNSYTNENLEAKYGSTIFQATFS